MKMLVSKKMSFDAAHFLPNYQGKCANMHGHRWTVELGVSGEVDPETGMVIDFAVLGGLLGALKNELDHTLLNDIIPNPTAENICLHIKAWGADALVDEGLRVELIRVWETPDSFAELKV